jgi:tetratricopeptide (TPR) repeat protein
MEHGMIEVLIVASGDKERSVLLQQLPRHRRVLPSVEDPNRYATVTFNVSVIGRRLPHAREVAIVIAPRDSAPEQALKRAMERWRPRMVIVLGSAQPLPGTDLKEGDVLIADRLLNADSEVSCLVKSGHSLSEQPLFKVVRDLDQRRWRELLDKGNEARRCLGTVAFSKNLIDAEKLRERWQNAMAIARDGGPMLSSLAAIPNSPPFVGIFGLVGSAEGPAFERAMQNAAAYTLACLGKEPEQVRRRAGDSTVERQMLLAEKLYVSATKHLQRGGLAEALTMYSQSITADPDYAEAYSNRGVVKMAMGDASGAIADYKAAILRKPDLGPAFYNMACAHGARARQQKEQAKDAELDLSQALGCLKQALKFGFTDIKHLSQDEDLALLRDKEAFQDLLSQQPLK